MADLEFDINDEHRLGILESMGETFSTMPQGEAHKLADEILSLPDDELKEIRERTELMAPVLGELARQTKIEKEEK